ncbi:MAG: hypothetical protein AAGF23_13680, partial [Acidobacteriota bacterium]
MDRAGIRRAPELAVRLVAGGLEHAAARVVDPVVPDIDGPLAAVEVDADGATTAESVRDGGLDGGVGDRAGFGDEGAARIHLEVLRPEDRVGAAVVAGDRRRERLLAVGITEFLLLDHRIVGGEATEADGDGVAVDGAFALPAHDEAAVGGDAQRRPGLG